jgi:hypothetical protein
MLDREFGTCLKTIARNLMHTSSTAAHRLAWGNAEMLPQSWLEILFETRPEWNSYRYIYSYSYSYIYSYIYSYSYSYWANCMDQTSWSRNPRCNFSSTLYPPKVFGV